MILISSLPISEIINDQKCLSFLNGYMYFVFCLFSAKCFNVIYLHVIPNEREQLLIGALKITHNSVFHPEANKEQANKYNLIFCQLQKIKIMNK